MIPCTGIKVNTHTTNEQEAEDNFVEVGSKVLFTINKNCDGKFRGKVVEVLR